MWCVFLFVDLHSHAVVLFSIRHAVHIVSQHLTKCYNNKQHILHCSLENKEQASIHELIRLADIDCIL